MIAKHIGTAADLVSARSTASPPTPFWTPGSSTRAPYRGVRWHVALNLALAALMIVVVGAGVWRAADGFGNGGDSGGDQQSAFAPDSRVWTPEPSDSTPEPGGETALLPTADECTVEPLTVDEVIWYIEDPISATLSRDIIQPATPEVDDESGSPPPTISGIDDSASIVAATPPDPLVASPPEFVPGPASAEQLAAVADIQREWMACVLADSPFQRWALESPTLVTEQVLPLLPTFASRDEARRILEEVEAGGEMEPSDDFWRQPNASYLMITSRGFPAQDTISIIDPATADSWTLDGRTITSTYSSRHDLGNGEVAVFEWDLTVQGTPIADVDIDLDFAGFDSCGSFEFTWFPERSQVLISGIPICG